MCADMDRSKAMDLAITQIERQFGKGSIMKLGGAEPVAIVPAISTGSLSLDIALGTFGVPRGRVIEIYGPESGGKTTLALHIVAEAQKKNGIAAFIDAEHALDVTYAKKIGVNTDELLISQPDSGEQALEIAETLVRSGALDVLVVDSVAAGSQSGTGRRNGRCPNGFTGAPHVAGTAQTHRQYQQVQNNSNFYQSAAHENRRLLRQSGNDNRRQCAEILFIPTARHPQDDFHQKWPGCDWFQNQS